MAFDDLLDRAAAFLRAHDDLMFIAHADADGICAMAILQQTCDTLCKRHRTHFLPQMSALALERLPAQDAIVFVDCGSSHLDAIGRVFAGRDVLVIDHHQVAGSAPVLLANPASSGLDGTREICSAGIAFGVAQRLLPGAVRLAPIAMIGAQADNQELGAYCGYNGRVLEEAVNAGTMRVRPGARLYGIESRPLLRLVANSYDLRIPGVTGDLRGARRFLDGLGLPAAAMFADLAAEQQERLEAALIAASPNPQARITHYTIVDAPAGPLRDTREAATLLNACGRLGQPQLGVDMLRGVPAAVARIPALRQEYSEAVNRAHRWLKDALRNKDPAVSSREGLVLINAADRIPAEIAGTLCSVLTKGGEVPEGTTVLCLARMGDGVTKVSARTRGSGRDLAAWVCAAARAVGGEGGGHAVAAGAVIPSDREGEFLMLLSGA